jgi:hypothetical protein
VHSTIGQYRQRLMPRYDRQRDPMTDFGLLLVALGALVFGFVWLIDRA